MSTDTRRLVNSGDNESQTKRKRKSKLMTKLNDSSKKPKASKSDVGNTGDSGNSSPYFQAGVTKSSPKLPYSFYDVSCEDLALALLGQTVVRMVDGKRLSGKIVETEAYLGPIDKAAHSYEGKKTQKNEAMFMTPGTAYVYNIYGMYCCLNISSKGDGAAVLLRALEPVENLETMAELRTKKKPDDMLKKQGRELCNGPSKLCQALSIKKDTVNKVDLCTSGDIWLEKGDDVDRKTVITCKRINIGYAEEWVDKPLRFYIRGSPFVSVKDKEAEKLSEEK